MNFFVLFGDGAITRKKMMETLHHEPRAMMHISVFLFFCPSDTSITKKMNK
jgi:hypothetical protein